MRGGDAAAGLDDALRAARLDPRDRALATELAYGTLKMRRSLAWSVSRCLDRPLASLDPVLQWVLLLGSYQLLCATRIPAHSAVDESVKLARARGHAGTAALANAVLRRLSRESPRPPRPAPPLDAAALADYASLPDWIAASLIGRFGDRALEIADGVNAAPRRAMWVNRGATSPAELSARLAAAGARVQPARYGLPDGLALDDVSAGRAEIDGALRDGCAQFQSEESMLAAALLAPRRGERVFDVCAGRGVKTAALASAVRPGGAVVSIDDDARKLELLRAAMRRFGMDEPATFVADARRPLPEAARTADAAIIDAPCSALGLLGRRPDVRWRKQPDDPQRHASIQGAILDNVAARVAAGGRILYAVCTWHEVETEDVIAGFLQAAGGAWLHRPLRIADAREALVQATPHGALVAPGIGGADGFYYSLLQRA